MHRKMNHRHAAVHVADRAVRYGYCHSVGIVLASLLFMRRIARMTRWHR